MAVEVRLPQAHGTINQDVHRVVPHFETCSHDVLFLRQDFGTLELLQRLEPQMMGFEKPRLLREIVLRERRLDEDFGSQFAHKESRCVTDLKTQHLQFVESVEGKVISTRVWKWEL